MTEQEHIQDWLRQHFPGIEAAAAVPRLQPSAEMTEAGALAFLAAIAERSDGSDRRIERAVRRIWRAMEATRITEEAESSA